jgi:hypothetical protein
VGKVRQARAAALAVEQRLVPRVRVQPVQALEPPVHKRLRRRVVQARPVLRRRDAEVPAAVAPVAVAVVAVARQARTAVAIPATTMRSTSIRSGPTRSGR